MDNNEILTEEQQRAVHRAIGCVICKDVYRIGGYAGTGKTTIAKHIVRGLNTHDKSAMICAFTGKAAYRLRQKGLSGAQTIHRTIYEYDPGCDEFILKEPDHLDGDYFLIDEGSMISAKLWEDVQSFNLPVILLGDPGQLEPIGKDPNLMRDPDIVLDKIHRQAAGSGIIQFATNVRKQEHDFTKASFYGPEVEIITRPMKQKPSEEDAVKADIVICGRNATRIKINKWYRKLMDVGGCLQVAEKIIVLKNSMELGVFNGQILTVDKVIGESDAIIKIDCHDEINEYKELLVMKTFFNKKVDFERIKSVRRMAVADYAYAITCHKSQGSEWNNVIVVDQQCPLWEAKRWRYTAITRAAEHVQYFC